MVRSEGRDDVRIDPAELLHRLLLSLFTSGDSFRQWMSLGPDGPELVAEFPSGTASTSATIFGGLDILRRRGHIDAYFFERLRTKFPRRGDDIARAATAWGASSHPPGPSARPSPAPGTIPRLAPFPGPLGQVFVANQERAELDIVGDRDGDVLRLRFHLHNDAALVHSRDAPGIAAIVQRVRERGPTLDGAAALAIGQALTTLLFGLPGEAAYHRLFRSLFRQPDEPALRIGPARRPVRCRLRFSDPELRALPWSLLAEDGHWLADDGWLFEFAAFEVARNHAQVHLQAPCTTLLIVPDIGRTANFNPARHRDDLVALLTDLWRKVVDQPLLGSYILTANTWSKVQDLAPRADVVYVCAQASDHGGRWTLRLDRPKGAQEDVRLDLFLRELQTSAKVVHLNVAVPRTGALMPGLCDLPGPQAVIAPWTAGFGSEAEAGGRQWLRALLGEGHDPVSALHVVTREQASARAGTMQAMTRYRGWRTTPAPAELYTGRARLHVDRRNQRLRF
ncbi:hypothetical protein OV090_18430 [Nannocystis sp. RBIL2]|uniref:hypothetical protein n=1 Tax=Nannocystis sp. RBIL2 TaxID=2996788 RepID=UPI00226FC82F|nr:hypothetical protein [Nannocystis sp. RBIL2]MCY1066758.1 hypothetical protein [Nannocystis sp. RBIL2]